MPRFYFHTRNGVDLTTALVRVEFNDLEAARGEALRLAKQALVEHMKGGESFLPQSHAQSRSSLTRAGGRFPS
ncbi:DUF6894 family protein [Enterovirga sp. CN4-39]|uniref:DUF6894 family protein n=1 Tax=Enterovirga sp. CN4-39 TaxID=3400910 RepID=UPI003C022731